MRYIFILLSLTLVGFSSASAQITPNPVQNQCVIISSANYGRCCSVGQQTALDEALFKRCEEYRTTGTIAGPQGGSQSSNPIGSTGDSSGGGSSTATTGIQGQSTITGNSCSSIRFRSLIDILIWIKCIIMSVLIPLIFALAFLVFLWGVFKFIASSDVKSKQEGQKVIWWGIIGLFVMVSIWGIIKILSTTLGIEATAVPLLQTEYLKK